MGKRRHPAPGRAGVSVHHMVLRRFRPGFAIGKKADIIVHPIARKAPMIKLLFAGTIFSSAFLLFLLQPLVSKHILPWFGGAAAVWASCMVFFQAVLLAGYAYSDWTTRH